LGKDQTAREVLALAVVVVVAVLPLVGLAAEITAAEGRILALVVEKTVAVVPFVSFGPVIRARTHQLVLEHHNA
jgi:hypothetical protein